MLAIAACTTLIAVAWSGDHHHHQHAHHAPDCQHFHTLTLNGKPACASLAPGSDPSAIDVLEDLIGHPQPNPLGYATTSRWSSTASGSGGSAGAPAVLTYSFVPDGTIPSEGSTISNTLHASFDAKFGSTDTWKDIFRESFAQWGELTGVTYIEETNDDSATWPESPGVLGVRGDIRIVAIPIDGASNVLGFNYFPNWGDMALDKDEPWADAGNDFRFFRNTLQHEMGHGLGLLHVWPLNNSKLMEPFLNENFSGPQDDDVRSGMSHYDDRAGANRDMESAFDIGTYADGLTVADMCLRTGDVEDWYWLDADPGDRFTVTAAPVGSAYQTGGDSGSTPTVDTLRQLPLDVTLYDEDGNLLRQSFGTLGEATTTAVLPLPAGLTGLFVRVSSTTSGGDVQRYSLEFDDNAAALHNLTVLAVNPEGFSAQFSPADVDGTGSALLSTPETLIYQDGERVSLTADPGTEAFEFTRWVINGSQQPDGQRTVEVDVTGTTEAIAYYGEIFDALLEGNRSLVPGESTLLTVTASGGQPPYTYSWAPPELVSNPTGPVTQVTPSEGSSLTVTITDAFGETVVRPVSFDFVEPLELSVTDDQSVIVGRFPLLEANVSGGTPPYKYNWSPEADNTDPTQSAYAPQIVEAIDMTFTVVVTDAAGRQLTDSVRIDAIAPLAVNLPDEQFTVAGESLMLSAAISGGQEPFTVRWFEGPRPVSSGSTQLEVAPTKNQMYLVEVTDASGQSAATVTRIEVAQPLQVVATASRTALKPGETAVIEALAQGGTAPLSYEWSPTLRLTDAFSNATSAFPEQTTVYTVTVTDALGRTTRDSVRLSMDGTVTQPLEDPFTSEDGGTPPEMTPIAPVATCGFGFASMVPLTALALLSGRRRRR